MTTHLKVKMLAVHFYWYLFCLSFSTFHVNASEYNITLSHNGPVVLGGTITFRADFYGENGQMPMGTFKYKWCDNAIVRHEYETEETLNTTTYWSISYPPENYSAGMYNVEVIVISCFPLCLWRITSVRTDFLVSQFLNGDIQINQSNMTVGDTYVSSALEANMTVNVKEGDLDFLKKATSVATYWFIDCKYYGQVNNEGFLYNFTEPDKSHVVEALVIASYDPPPKTVMSTTTTTTTTTIIPSITSNSTEETVTIMPNVTVKALSPSTTVPSEIPTDNETFSLPYICSNSTIIPPDINKTYGHFTKRINVRAPIMNITVEGTNWIQPWDMLSLNVTCRGSGPFYKCLHFHRGKYNVTGNETCNNGLHLQSCNFSIIHYFLEPSIYTILIVLNNDVSKQIYPLTINIYKVTTKPQLSVIVVPVTCSLAAVVLIVFGIAYYIQSRARFTVEVADFDFGQNNPEMEYKTFRERLRDSFDNTVRPGSERISGYQPLSNPETLQ